LKAKKSELENNEIFYKFINIKINFIYFSLYLQTNQIAPQCLITLKQRNIIHKFINIKDNFIVSPLYLQTILISIRAMALNIRCTGAGAAGTPSPALTDIGATIHRIGTFKIKELSSKISIAANTVIKIRIFMEIWETRRIQFNIPTH
jgi:hypothetical protein